MQHVVFLCWKREDLLQVIVLNEIEECTVYSQCILVTFDRLQIQIMWKEYNSRKPLICEKRGYQWKRMYENVVHKY